MIRRIIPGGITNTIDASIFLLKTFNVKEWYCDVNTKEIIDIIFEEERKAGRAMLIEWVHEDRYKLTFVHLYNKPRKKFIGFIKHEGS